MVSTSNEELFLVHSGTGTPSFLASGGSLIDIQGVTFDGNRDVVVIDGTSGVVQVSVPNGAQGIHWPHPGWVAPSDYGAAVRRDPPAP